MTTNVSPQPQPANTTQHARSVGHYQPHVDIVEGPEGLTLVADMPGLSPEQIDIHFERGALQIYGRVPSRHAEGLKYHRREYGVGDFYRSFKVSEQVDATKISAEYKQGVLTLQLAQSSAAKPQKINVRAG